MECLITKLKGVVSDSNLKKLNELRFTVNVVSNEGNYMLLRTLTGTSTTVSVIEGGNISKTSGSGYAKSVSLTPGENCLIYFQGLGKFTLSIDNKFNLEYFSNLDSTLLDLDDGKRNKISDVHAGELTFCHSLRNISLNLSDDADFGDVSNLFSHYDGVGMISFKLKGNNYSGFGDLGAVVSRTSSLLAELDIDVNNNTDYYGEINKVAKNSFIIENKASVGKKFNLSINIGNSEKISSSLVEFSVKIPTQNVDLSAFSTVNAIKKLYLDNSTSKEIGYITGDLSNINADCSLYHMLIKGVKRTDGNTITLSNAPKYLKGISTRAISNQSATDVIRMKWVTSGANAVNIIGVEGAYFLQGTADFIKAMSNLNLASGTFKWEKAIQIVLAEDLTSSAAAGDSALQTAISTLQGKGVTVSIGYSDTAVNEIALMSAKKASKYGIVYKGKELIVEPSDTNKTLVAPAYDCTYKEFATKEEADNFIKANGLVKSESK